MTDTSTTESPMDFDSEGDSTRVYEVGYLLLPSIPEEHIPEHVTAIKAVIEGAHGVSLSEEDPKLRTLAYEMVKHIGTENVRFNSAYFGSLRFEVAGNSLPGIKIKLEAIESMLRALIMKTTPEHMHPPHSPSTKESGEVVAEESTPSQESTLTPEPASQDELDKSIDALVAE